MSFCLLVSIADKWRVLRARGVGTKSLSRLWNSVSVKHADGDFAPRKRSAFVSVEPRQLGRSILQNCRELLVAFKGPMVSHRLERFFRATATGVGGQTTSTVEVASSPCRRNAVDSLGRPTTQ
jgi:hypothetical protein